MSARRTSRSSCSIRGGEVLAERGRPNAPLLPLTRWPVSQARHRRCLDVPHRRARRNSARDFPSKRFRSRRMARRACWSRTSDAALRPVDYEFDIDPEIDAGIRQASPAVRGDAVAAPAARAQSRPSDLLSSSASSRLSSPPRDAFPGLSAILVWRLGGVAASEFTSLGAHTDLWRPNEGDLSSMVDKLGWRRLFPPMRKAWDTLGTLKS